MLIFSATEICAELCFQSTWGHLPQLSAKFELWMKHLSVFDMKQQYFLKLILLRVSLCSVQVSFHKYPVSSMVCCYVAYLSSGFGNSKMVTECEPKPISMNFGSPRRGKGGFMCGRHGVGLDWPEKKDSFSNNVLLIFAAIKI